MKSIGGNTAIALQKKTVVENEIGEKVPTWETQVLLQGFLDKQSGEAHIETFDGKVQDTTHMFICDYAELDDLKPENCRALIGSKIFNVLDIDDPMGLHHSLEITLRFIGWQDG